MRHNLSGFPFQDLTFGNKQQHKQQQRLFINVMAVMAHFTCWTRDQKVKPHNHQIYDQIITNNSNKHILNEQCRFN